MYSYHPSICNSAYVLWKRLVTGRKDTGLKRIKMHLTDNRIERMVYIIYQIGNLSYVIEMIKRGYLFDDYCIAYAMTHGHLRIIKYCYNNGYNLVSIDWQLCGACYNGHLKLAKWLYRMGANLAGIDNTPIRWASERGHLHVVKWLCKMGCDPTVDAIKCAEKSGNKHISNFLQSIIPKNDVDTISFVNKNAEKNIVR